jgi:signal transduction histidine kinase
MFNKAASRQITVYIWTGAMVILVILLVGLFAGQAVGRQIRLNKMKNNFIATVSHELKTPLASMRLLVDTLLEKRVRDEAHAEEYLNMIARENERLTRVIENFLSFSRMERNRNAFTMLPTAPTDIVENAVESICTKYKANGCKLEMDLTEDLPEITVDADALVTVLINLLDNACKYTGADKQIRLSLTVDNEEICFAVADNGIGLTRRQIHKIFNHFYQVDSSLARSSEGCGLGLSIVQFIVNAHKGRIDVESRPGEGCTFSVYLPRND